MYTIGDMIIRIKNGYMAKREFVEAPYSNFSINILKKLEQFGYIKDYQIEKDKRKLIINLLYKDSLPAITDVQIFSRPGRKWYTTSKQLKPVLSGTGFSILSTPKGILTNIEAKKAGLGGELLFNIW